MTIPFVASVVGGLLAHRHFALRRRDPARFLATVSHELRTPLNAIIGWVNLLKSGRLPAEETAHALESIERNVLLEARLVDQLLDASRLLGGRATLVCGPIDLRKAVDAVVARVTPAAVAKGIELQAITSGDPALISGDERRLEDVVWHLLSNAVKFTPSGGRVQVDVGVTGGSAYLRVADTGEGIAAEDLPHVFEPFLQGRTDAKRAGLGLGLAIVRQLVELHGGTISAHSAGRGHGAVFRATLPLVSSQSGSPETRAQ